MMMSQSQFQSSLRKEKEGLNDNIRCDYCYEPVETMTFVTRRGGKQVLCPSCVSYDQEKTCDEHVVILKDHLRDIDEILQSKSVVSVKLLMNTWEYYSWENYQVGMNVIRRIIEMNELNNEYDVNVLKLLDELRFLRKLVIDELVRLQSFW